MDPSNMSEISAGSTTHHQATTDVELQDATLDLDNRQALAGASTIPTGIADSTNSTGNDSGRVQADLGGEATDGETTLRAVSCKWASMRNSCCGMLTLHKVPVISRTTATALKLYLCSLSPQTELNLLYPRAQLRWWKEHMKRS